MRNARPGRVDRALVARTAALLLEKDLGLAGTVIAEPDAQGPVKVRLQGGALGVPLSRWVKKGEVFSLVLECGASAPLWMCLRRGKGESKAVLKPRAPGRGDLLRDLGRSRKRKPGSCTSGGPSSTPSTTAARSRRWRPSCHKAKAEEAALADRLCALGDLQEAARRSAKADLGRRLEVERGALAAHFRAEAESAASDLAATLASCYADYGVAACACRALADRRLVGGLLDEAVPDPAPAPPPTSTAPRPL
jgi:hypothetical protein